MTDKLSTWLRSLHPPVFVLALLFASYAVVLPLAFLQTAAPSLELGPGPANMQTMSLPWRLLLGSLVSPLLETALFQWAPIRLLRSRKLTLPWPAVLFVSAALFAAGHTYSTGYVVFAFLIGLVFAYGYAALDDEPRGMRAFVLVCLVHALRNGIASLLQ
ncbi:MAG TPA: CPBP family glutamic-type intramembrane protease [Methylibium sp.]